MKVILVYRDEELGNSWRNEFKNLDQVDIIQDDILEVEADAIVSPANSFGCMDGGLDYALSEKFGWDLEVELQKKIKKLPEGELLVGKALIIETGTKGIPYLISAPTMRVPMSFNISTSVNAYLAMKAILIAAKNHPNIISVSVPGLCTGVGKMPPEIAAHQMFMAYSEIIQGKKKNFEGFSEAQMYHWKLNETGLIYD